MVLAPTVLPDTDAEAFAAYGPVTVLFANVIMRSLVAGTSRVLREVMSSRRLTSVSSELAGVERLFELTERSLVAGHGSGGGTRASDGQVSDGPSPAGQGPDAGPAAGEARGSAATASEEAAPLTEAVVDGPTDRERARALMAEAAFDYCAGGAGDESGMRRNVERLDAITLTPGAA
ncbi:hypothetical protein ACFQ3Z_01305 [Streptomyces nogalater]